MTVQAQPDLLEQKWIYPPVVACCVSERLLYAAASAERILTPMQVLKLVYISHGWMLGLLDQPLISENVEAWRYGPVVRSVYRQYRTYRSNPIAERGAPHAEQLSREQQSLMDQVFARYGPYSGIQLSQLTHQTDTPWDIAQRLDMPIIPNELIRDYYRRRAAELKNAHGN